MPSESPITDVALALADPKILIVDDETAQMQALCNILNDHGFATTGFSDPRAAIAGMAGTRFDIVLSDLMMPGTDGITLLKTLLEMDPNLVGIIMTGAGTIASAVEAMKSGALDYILKPFKLSEILPVLHRALTVRRLRLENAELALRLKRRTEELELMNKHLEAFSFSVSHDLRTPLRVISGFSQILLEDHAQGMPSEAQGLLQDITKNTRRMEELIKDLLRLARVGMQPISRTQVDMEALVREVCEDQVSQNRKYTVDLQFGALPGCLGDAPLIRQVLVNLISNAFKFTRRSEHPRIDIGSRQVADQVEYYVRDNGVGIPPQHAQKLFGAFQRLHSDEEFEGTGVGLSIVQRIIHRHGGVITASSAPGQGTTFSFTLSAAGGT